MQCLLTKNMIKAYRTTVFSIIQSVVDIKALDPKSGITGYSVGLAPALIWLICEARLHNGTRRTMVFNVKLDGRPFLQVS